MGRRQRWRRRRRQQRRRQRRRTYRKPSWCDVTWCWEHKKSTASGIDTSEGERRRRAPRAKELAEGRKSLRSNSSSLYLCLSVWFSSPFSLPLTLSLFLPLPETRSWNVGRNNDRDPPKRATRLSSNVPLALVARPQCARTGVDPGWDDEGTRRLQSTVFAQLSRRAVGDRCSSSLRNCVNRIGQIRIDMFHVRYIPGDGWTRAHTPSRNCISVFMVNDIVLGSY